MFIAPQTYPSWVLNETSWTWEAPTPMPELTEEQIAALSHYTWNEETTAWELVTP